MLFIIAEGDTKPPLSLALSHKGRGNKLSGGLRQKTPNPPYINMPPE
jgi:hypothetical protein